MMSTEAASATLDLPVPVLQYPHWRVNFRPEKYEPDLIPTVGDCKRIIEQCRVSLRGWDFPHLGSEREIEEGSHFVASWAHFEEPPDVAIEYWRFYQSGQFLHLNAIEEWVSKEWRKRLEVDTRHHLSNREIDWSQVHGFVSLSNLFYRIVEIVEFAIRLCQKDVYRDHLAITIELKRIKDFVLGVEPPRLVLPVLRQCKQESLGHTWTAHTTQLISGGHDLSVEIAKWFLQGFGSNPSDEMLRRELQDFLTGRV